MRKTMKRFLVLLLAVLLAAAAFPTAACAEDAEWPIYCPYWRQYTGCAVNFKTTKVSYKVHKKVDRPLEEQQIIPNMQPAIITSRIWTMLRKCCVVKNLAIIPASLTHRLL